MSASEHDAYEGWSASYVLSALDPAEKSAFEKHLRGCPTCQAEVQDFAVLPGLLAQVSPDEIDTSEQARLTARAVETARTELQSLEHSNRRWRQRALLSIAASVVLLAGFAVLLGLRDGPGEVDVAFTSEAVGTVTVSEQDWGTRLELDLLGLSSRPEYRLWTIDDSGERAPVMTWPSPPAGVAKVSGGTALTLDQIDQLIITGLDDPDDVVLTADV